MAITRCPYCHAIIDENDKYCNNCGTQLLFPEDDERDEEIPGEKIIDAEVEEKDYTVDEPEGEKRPASAGDVEDDLDEELEEEMREEAAEKALDELISEEEPEDEAREATEEVILVDEIAASEADERARTGELEKTAEPGGEDGPAGADEEDEKEVGKGKEEETLEEEEEEEGEEEKEGEVGAAAEEEEKEEEEELGEDEDREPEEKVRTEAVTGATAPEERTAAIVEPAGESGSVDEEEPAVEYITAPPDEEGDEDQAAATAGESALRPVTFDTKELEGLGRTVDLSKEKIDKFVQVMAERKPPASPPPAPEPAGPQAETGGESTGNLPPWASTMKGAPVFPADTSGVEPRKGPGRARAAEEDEVEIFPRRKPSDSSMGLPEKISQAPLPFGREETREEGELEAEAEAEAVAEAEEELIETVPSTPSGLEAGRPARPSILPGREPGRVEAAALDEIEEPAEKPPFSFSVFIKSKAFDVLFVGLFWLVALWLAANATGQTLFEILGTVSGPMLLLYAVLVFLYFFLFKFFLGETLGDRLFRPRD